LVTAAMAVAAAVAVVPGIFDGGGIV
jgi:hypothetical protein